MHRWIVAAASWFVPRDRRAEWRAEWDAEMAAHERRCHPGAGRPNSRLLRHSVGAIVDAAILQAGAWRTLRFLVYHWRVTATAILSLAAAVTATIVALACWDALLHRPPGVTAPGELRVVDVSTPDEPSSGISYEDFRTLQAASHVLPAITAYPYRVSTVDLDDRGHIERLVTTAAVDNYFDVLGVKPRLGTLRLPVDGGITHDAVVISEGLWQRLGSDPGIAGKQLRLNQQAVTVFGVVPASFRGMLFLWNPDVWMSFKAADVVTGTSPTLLTDRTQHWLFVVARMPTRMTDAAATSEINTLLTQIARQHPAEPHRTAVLSALRTTPASERSWMSPLIATFVVSVLLMLTVACANVTNLLLGLALGRRYESTVRAALGASRWRLMLPAIRESLALAMLAGVIAFVAARVTLAWLSSYRLSIGSIFPSPSIDLRPGLLVIAIAGTLIVIAGASIGLLVAWRSSRDGLATTINASSLATHTPRTRLRDALVLVQMAVATLVLVALAVAVTSLIRLQQAPLGFSTRELAFIGIDMRRSGYDEQRGPAFYDQIRDRLRGLPGIESVSLADGPPFGNGWGRDSVSRPDEPARAGRGREIRLSVVDDRYFSTMGIDVIAGRIFDATDRAGAPETVVVNATMARTFWPNATAVGQRLLIANHHRTVTVIGVVADGKYEEVDEPQGPFMYYALAQHYLNDVVAVVRTTPRGGPTVTTIGNALNSGIPHLTFGGLGLMSLDQLLALPLFFSRAVAALVGAVCLVTLLLAMAGLYSSVFYSVSQRRQELAVRMLLGAGTKEILTIVVRRMAGAAMAGAVTGVAAAAAVLPAIASLFFGIKSAEPVLAVTVACAAIGLVLLTTLTVVWPLTRQAPSVRTLHRA